MQLVYLTLLGIANGGSALVAGRRQLGKTLQQAMIWVLIFVGVIGAPEEKAKVLKKLNAKHGFIQNVVMKRVVLRNTHHFSFVSDDSVERGVRVLNILEEIGEIDLPEDPEDGGKTSKL